MVSVDSENTSLEDKPDEIQDEPDGDLEAVVDETTVLREELEVERQRSAAYEDKFKRALADYMNLERRSALDTQNGINSAIDSLLRDFLDIHDDFIRARDAYHSDGLETVGLDSVIRNVEAMLKRRNIDAIQSVGHIFDPHLHEAMLTKMVPDLDENTITRELRKGYITKGRVVRPALVEISTKEMSDK